MLMFYLAMIDDKEEKLTFENLYLKYSEDVFRRIFYEVHNECDAEDIMQETWIAFIDKISFIHNKDDNFIKSYILRIARNKAITFFRKKGKEEEIMCDIDIENLSDDLETDSIIYNLCKQIDIVQINECLNELETDYRDVLNYYYLNDNSIDEIAKIMDLNPANVKVRLHRGRTKLAKLLEGRIER